MISTTTMIRVATYSSIIAMGVVVWAATVPGASAQSAKAAKAKPTAEEITTRAAACRARAYHVWAAPHAAGDINPRTKRAFARDSNGACRLDVRAVRKAIEAGAIKG